MPSTPKPATGEWENYSSKDFDGWIFKGKTFTVTKRPAPVGTETKHEMNEKVLIMIVGVLELPPAEAAETQANIDRFLDAMAENMKQSGGKKAYDVEVKRVVIDGLPGRELLTRATPAIGSRARLCFANGKFYTITAAGPLFEKGFETQIDPYFDNFIPK